MRYNFCVRMVILICSSLLFLFTAMIYLMRAEWLGLQYGATDFYRFYESTLFYFSGQSIYSPTIVEWVRPVSVTWVTASGNLNPPFFTLLLLPFSYFNYAHALLLWNVVLILLTCVGGVLALKPFPQWRKNTLPIVALLLVYLPTQGNFDWGQLGTLLLCLLALLWIFAREHKDNLAGFILGLACSIKLFCGLFLLYFWFIKRRRVFWIALMTLGITFLIGGLFFGFASYRSYVLDLNRVGWYTSTWNASLYGFFERLFHGNGYNIPWKEMPFLASAGSKLCWMLLLVYLVVVWKEWGERYFDRGFSLTLVGMLLLSPLGWVYYFPVLLICYFVLIAQENDTVHLFCALLLFLSTLCGHMTAPKTWVQIFWSGSVGFYVLLGLVVLLRRPYFPHRWIPVLAWPVIYSVIFVPSLLLLWSTLRGLSG